MGGFLTLAEMSLCAAASVRKVIISHIARFQHPPFGWTSLAKGNQRYIVRGGPLYNSPNIFIVNLLWSEVELLFTAVTGTFSSMEDNSSYFPIGLCLIIV